MSLFRADIPTVNNRDDIRDVAKKLDIDELYVAIVAFGHNSKLKIVAS